MLTHRPLLFPARAALAVAGGSLFLFSCAFIGLSSSRPPAPYSLKVVGERQLTSTTNVSEYPISWSPNGKELAMTIFAGVEGKEGIYMEIINVKTGDRHRILPPSSYREFHPMWSPDGTRLAFFSNRSGNLDVWTVNRDGTHLTQLTTDTADDLYPTWSPDGTRIAFLSSRSKEVGIWTMNPDGTDQRQLTAGGNGDWGTAWNPKGRLIAFGSSRLSAANQPKDVLDTVPSFEQILVSGIPSTAIWTVDAETRTLKKLTQEREDGYHWHPEWSPDGMKLAYVSNRLGTMDIWTMDADGGHPEPLTSNKQYNVFPVWSPDGRQLAYATSQNFISKTDIKILTLRKGPVDAPPAQ